MDATQAKKIEDMTFEAALAELEGIVKNLETGQTALEESIKSYERGVALKEHCEKKLGEAQAKIETITVNKEDGSIKTEPFAEQE